MTRLGQECLIVVVLMTTYDKDENDDDYNDGDDVATETTVM